MNLLNYRRGFACNSSSTHSIISGMKAATTEFSDFGWDQFKVHPADIGIYLAAAIQYSYAPINKPQMCAILGISESQWPSKGFVDHQSCPVILRSPKTGHVLPLFIKDLVAWYRRHDAGVLGGNDNCEADEWEDPWDYGTPVRAPFPTDVGIMWGRKEGDWWIAFDSQDGTKVTFSFEDDPAPLVLPTPELVDLKITQYCPYGCEYCYQGSTRAGQHAPIEQVKRILQDCANSRVFEIAFGGGEATLHPQFTDIIDFADGLGLCCNLTTRNFKFIHAWVRGEHKKIKGLAVSIDTLEGARKLVDICKSVPAGARPKAQMVDGIGDPVEVTRILGLLEENHIEVTWLGFKEVGFGGEYRTIHLPQWRFSDLVLSREEYKWGISVDTAMLAKYGDVLKNKYGKHGYGVTARAQEGEVSCYIDAVEGEIAASSYCRDRQKYVGLKAQFVGLKGD